MVGQKIIKDCPFCGFYARLANVCEIDPYNESEDFFIIMCDRCRARTRYYGFHRDNDESKIAAYRMALTDWNKRVGEE